MTCLCQMVSRNYLLFFNLLFNIYCFAWEKELYSWRYSVNKTTAEAVCSHITSKSRGLLRKFSWRLDFESEGFPQAQGNPQGSSGSTGGPQQLLRALWHPTAGSSPFHCTLPSHSWGITKAHRLAPQQKELGGLEENIWTNDSGQVLCSCHFCSFFFSLNHFCSRKEKHALPHTAELSLRAALGHQSRWFSERRGKPERGIASSGCCSGCLKECQCPRHHAAAQRYILPARKSPALSSPGTVELAEGRISACQLISSKAHL